MTKNSRLFASLTFAAVAIFLVIYTWLPTRDSMQREEARVTNIIAQSNTWYEIEITTSSGIRLTCRTRHGWPLIGPNSCPLEEFERLLGEAVSVLHDGNHPFEVAVGSRIVIDYSSHQRAQTIAVVLAVLMLTMALWVWRRNEN